MLLVYMLHDTMLQNSNIVIGELNELTNMLGMNCNDVNNILVKSPIKEYANLSMGPKPY